MGSDPGSISTISSERVRLIIDSWSYRFGLRTFGGGFIRCILVFSEGHLVVIETSHVATSPPPWYGGLARWASSHSSGLDAIATGVFWGLIEAIIRRFRGDPEAKLVDEFEYLIGLSKRSPETGRALDEITDLLRKSGIKKVAPKYVYSYSEIGDVKLDLNNKKKYLVIEFTAQGKKHKYIVYHRDWNRITELSQQLKNILGVNAL